MSLFGSYILDADGNVCEATSLEEWGRFMADRDARLVAFTPTEEMNGVCYVSTVFLGIDHSFGNDTPVLWETLVFGGPCDGDMERYTSREDALAGHEVMVQKTRARIVDDLGDPAPRDITLADLQPVEDK